MSAPPRGATGLEGSRRRARGGKGRSPTARRRGATHDPPRGLSVVLALLCVALAAQAQGEPRHYERNSRARYVRRALEALRSTDSTTLKNTRRYIHVVDRNRCRSTFTDLRTSCLLAAARKSCRGDDRTQRRCHLVSDVIIANKLGEKELLDLQTRYRIMSTHKRFRPELRRELWRRYADLVAELRLSRFFRRGDGDLAASIDAFCMQAVHRRGLSWQYCVAAVVWFAGTNDNRID